MAIDLLGADECDSGSLGDVVDEWAVEFGLQRDGLHLLGSVRFNLATVQKGAQLPSVAAVEGLHRGLMIKLHLDPNLARALQLHHEG